MEITIKSYLKRLHCQLQQDLIDWTDINCGGCGSAALAISEVFDQIGIEHKIVTMSEPGTSNAKLQNYKKGISWHLPNSHILILVDDIVIDTDECRSIVEYKWKPDIEDPITRDDLKFMLLQRDFWNDHFIRVNSHLSDLDEDDIYIKDDTFIDNIRDKLSEDIKKSVNNFVSTMLQYNIPIVGI